MTPVAGLLLGVLRVLGVLGVLGALVGPAPARADGSPPDGGTGSVSGSDSGTVNGSDSGPVAGSGAGDSLIMVLDSSGSMAGPDGSGGTRIDAARKAVSGVVDGLPDGFRTGLRIYGAGEPRGCDDTRLTVPVTPLDRAALKAAAAAVRPKGDTPIGLSLRKAAAHVPRDGRRTILLVSDGEDNCGTPTPCEVAAQLTGGQGSGSGGGPAIGPQPRIDTVGFQVSGVAREQLGCIARAGHGAYYDAPDAAALARQLVRASRLTADAYRFQGERAAGGPTARQAPGIGPGQYLDTIGPGETRWYAASLDAASTADFAVTAVPRPGAKAAYGDGVDLELKSTAGYGPGCDRQSAHFGQDEGAMVLTAAVSRIPSDGGKAGCDPAGRYLLSVSRTSGPGSDASRWPVEIRYTNEAPLKAGTIPAAARTDYGTRPAPVTGDPKAIQGGTGFNDARRLGKGVWRDALLPAQTRFYKVRLGWGQQLTYTAEFANEPLLSDSSASSYVATAAYGPDRQPVQDASGGTVRRAYYGKPLSVGLGTVPVTWTNRWVSGGAAPAVRSAGDYYIAVSLGPAAATLARNAAVGVVLRVNVTGDELSGPQYRAPALAKGTAKDTGKDTGKDASSSAGDAAPSGDGGGVDGGVFMTGTDMVAAGAGGAVALAGVGAVVLASRSRRGGA